MDKRLIFLVVVILLLGFVFSGGCKEQSDLNKAGSSMDWGPDHYWNSGNERVEKKAW